MSAAFAFYDWFVWKRNDKVFSAAVRSGAIVSSLFPSAVRERLYEEADEKQAQAKLRKNGNASQKWLSDDLVDPTFQSEIDGEFLPYKTKPIADRKGRIELCDVTFPTLLTYSLLFSSTASVSRDYDSLCRYVFFGRCSYIFVTIVVANSRRFLLACADIAGYVLSLLTPRTDV